MHLPQDLKNVAVNKNNWNKQVCLAVARRGFTAQRYTQVMQCCAGIMLLILGEPERCTMWLCSMQTSHLPSIPGTIPYLKDTPKKIISPSSKEEQQVKIPWERELGKLQACDSLQIELKVIWRRLWSWAAWGWEAREKILSSDPYIDLMLKNLAWEENPVLNVKIKKLSGPEH